MGCLKCRYARACPACKQLCFNWLRATRKRLNCFDPSGDRLFNSLAAWRAQYPCWRRADLMDAGADDPISAYRSTLPFEVNRTDQKGNTHLSASPCLVGTFCYRCGLRRDPVHRHPCNGKKNEVFAKNAKTSFLKDALGWYNSARGIIQQLIASAIAYSLKQHRLRQRCCLLSFSLR